MLPSTNYAYRPSAFLPQGANFISTASSTAAAGQAGQTANTQNTAYTPATAQSFNMTGFLMEIFSMFQQILPLLFGNMPQTAQSAAKPSVAQPAQAKDFQNTDSSSDGSSGADSASGSGTGATSGHGQQPPATKPVSHHDKPVCGQPKPPSKPPCPTPPPVCQPKPCPPETPGGTTGSITGDPHFVGFNGEKYDIQGQDGKTYNLLSDKDFELNGKYKAYGTKGAMVVGEAGLVVGNDNIDFNPASKSAPTLNGQPIPDGKTMTVDGGTLKWDAKSNTLTINSREYNTTLTGVKSGTKDAYVNTSVTLGKDGVLTDYVSPHGLLGQTAANAKAHTKDGTTTGDKGVGAQGGNVIDKIGPDGKVAIRDKNDKSAITDYQTSGLFKDDSKFNRFGYNPTPQDWTDGGKLTVTKDDHGNVTQLTDAKSGQVIFKGLITVQKPKPEPGPDKTTTTTTTTTTTIIYVNESGQTVTETVTS